MPTVPRPRRSAVAATALALLAAAALLPRPIAAQPAAPVPTPSAALGIDLGADRVLADWGQLTRYYAALAAASPAVRLDTLGRSTQGRPFVLLTISTPENIRKIEDIRATQARLADPRGLSPAERARALAEQPAVVVVSCNIHSSEIGSSQMAAELAYRLATNDTLQRELRDVVVLLIPSMNPDGQQMVVDWYRAQLGTPWEGGPMPWLYHPYVGHDNNRDWYTVTQLETRLVTNLLYRRWFPDIFYDVHQQGSYGMRLTVPPHVDPIDPNVDARIVRGISQIGATMSWALQAHGKQGVGDAATYDLWWHGGARSTPTRHNMIGLLTEAASARIATPITISPEQLQGHGRGLPTYERRVNFPDPWPGGVWRLRDIMDYEEIAVEALVKLASDQRAQYVRTFADLGATEVRLGASEAPYAWVIPAGQHDPGAVARLVEILRVGGVEVDSAAAPVTLGGRRYPAGSFVIDMAQPYRAHAKDLLEPQRYPKIERYPGGPPERPYDVTGWTLPYQMGVRVETVGEPLPPRAQLGALVNPCGPMSRDCPAGPGPLDLGRCPQAAAGGRGPLPLPAANTACYLAVGPTLARGRAVALTSPGIGTVTVRRLPRVALYRPWTGNMDEGWTRWLLEQFRLPYRNVTDSAVKAGRLRDQFDVLLVPDMSLREMRDGMPASQVPPRYAGGLGEAGLAALRAFVADGGTLVLLDRATELATTTLGVGVHRITVPARLDEGTGTDSSRGAGGATAPLYAPGSVLRVLVDRRAPLAYGMPDTAAVYFTNSTSFDVPAGSPVRVVARYPERGEDILLSGYLQGADAIAGKAAAVVAPVGRGRVVLFGFRPQYRGQSYGTFRMLFNALLDATGSGPQ